MSPQKRGEPPRGSTPGRNSQGSHMSSIVLPPSQWPTDTRKDVGSSGVSSGRSRGGALASQMSSRPATAGSSRARAQSAERVRPRSASSAGRAFPESPVRRPRVRDIPKMYYELPQAPQVEQKVYKPPFWSEDTWGTAECISPKELNKRGLSRTLSGKNLTLRTRSLNLVSLGEKEKEMKEVMKTRRTLHEGDKQALQRTFRAVARTQVCRVTLEEFVEAWGLLGVEVSKEEAASFFHVYGMDKQGLMPYQVFTNALLTLPAKMRGMGAIRRGAFEKDEQKEFLGKIMYAKCKTGVFAPTSWNPALGERSAQPPKASMRLEWVQGYSGHNNVSPNLFYTANGDMLYYSAAVGIVYNKETHSQKFFLGHTDDIMCLAIHPDRHLVATGQNGVIPFLCVWDSRDQSLVRRIDYEEGMCAIVCAAFSPDGKYLTAVATDNNHTIYIHDWQKGKQIWTGRGQPGEPPQVFGVCWSPFHPNVWASYGVKHLKFWRLRDGTWQDMAGAYGRSSQPFNILSCVFLPSGTVLAGTLDGQISVWTDGKLQYLVDAHADASKLTQMTGAKRQRGLRCITLRSDKCTLLSAGSDGHVHQWDVSSGTLPRNARPINKPGFLSHLLRSPHKGERLPTIKGMDCQVDNDNDTFIVGTSKCEIWEVGDDTAEVLIHGHTDDIYTAEWHPILTNLYVSACESGRVYVWDAIKRRLLRTCNVGFPCRSVAIQPGSPENPHVAVGGKLGQTCVVRFSNLEPLFTWKDCANSIDDLKYSPDGSKLATASHDLVIDLYNARDSYSHIARCHGHSATVGHLDWSADGTILQSNCNDYEILYWDARTGRKVTASMRDVDWATWTCVLGFPVMGIWRADMDGTDINSCDRSRSRHYLVTADDMGRVSLMNYPAVVQHAPVKVFNGHSSHVQNVRFSPDDARVISAGSHDRAVFQWRTHAIRRNADGSIAAELDPLCTAEDCAACGTRPPPPPPPRVWGPLDDSGRHFGWIKSDGTSQRWSRRASTLVEEEESAGESAESDIDGEEETGGATVVGGQFGDRSRLAAERPPGQPIQRGEPSARPWGKESGAESFQEERTVGNAGGHFNDSHRLAREPVAAQAAQQNDRGVQSRGLDHKFEETGGSSERESHRSGREPVLTKQGPREAQPFTGNTEASFRREGNSDTQEDIKRMVQRNVPPTYDGRTAEITDEIKMSKLRGVRDEFSTDVSANSADFSDPNTPSRFLGGHSRGPQRDAPSGTEHLQQSASRPGPETNSRPWLDESHNPNQGQWSPIQSGHPNAGLAGLRPDLKAQFSAGPKGASLPGPELIRFQPGGQHPPRSEDGKSQQDQAWGSPQPRQFPTESHSNPRSYGHPNEGDRQTSPRTEKAVPQRVDDRGTNGARGSPPMVETDLRSLSPAASPTASRPASVQPSANFVEDRSTGHSFPGQQSWYGPQQRQNRDGNRGPPVHPTAKNGEWREPLETRDGVNGPRKRGTGQVAAGQPYGDGTQQRGAPVGDRRLPVPQPSTHNNSQRRQPIEQSFEVHEEDFDEVVEEIEEV